MFVTGEREAVWARKMGYAEDRIWRGLYTCDVDAFAKAPADLSRPGKRFLYAGRLSKEKGIDTLRRSYELYRRGPPHPPPLGNAGAGPLRPALQGTPGVVLKGILE